jgi:class 3 adenylate cyclase
LLLADGRASRRHAAFRFEQGALIVEDLGSSNGTTHNGTPIIGAVRAHAGDVIGIGDCEILVGTAVGVVGSSSPPGALATEMEVAESPRSSIAKLSESVIAQDMVPELDFEGDTERTFTIVFSDIENSTVIATTLGDEAWLRSLDIHNRIIRSELERHGGREIKSQGDGFMLSFDSARAAVRFAIAVQAAIADYAQRHPEWGIRVRIGIHTGEAVRRSDGDLFGRHVIVASRIADKATGGEILVSSLARQLSEGQTDLRFEAGRTVSLKGVGEQVVHGVSWNGE